MLKQTTVKQGFISPYRYEIRGQRYEARDTIDKEIRGQRSPSSLQTTTEPETKAIEFSLFKLSADSNPDHEDESRSPVTAWNRWRELGNAGCSPESCLVTARKRVLQLGESAETLVTARYLARLPLGNSGCRLVLLDS